MTNTKRPTLFFLTTELPYPADSGGRIKTFRLVEFLSRHFNVRLLCAQGGEHPGRMKEFKALVPVESVQAFSNFKKRTPLNWFLGVMSFPSFNSYRIFSRELEAMVQWGVAAADVTVVDHLEMMYLIPENFRGKLIYHSHNAEFRLWEEFARLEQNPLKKWAIEWEASRVKVLERYAIRKAAFTFAAPNDSVLLSKELNQAPEKFRLTYHLGNDALLDLPAPDVAHNAKRIFYAGTLSWEPNRDGLVWFIRECWNAIRQKEPEAELVVCGRGADVHLANLLRHTPGVTYHGFVEDLEPLMNTCRLAIVPLRFGSGMKVKTFDALYRGLPLVCTPTGAEGIELQHTRHAFIANTAVDFAASVCRLLENGDVAAAIAAEGRLLVRQQYSYEYIFKSMQESISSVLS